MIDSVAGATGCVSIADAGRRGPKGDSGTATDPFGPWPTGAARHPQTVVGVVESII